MSKITRREFLIRSSGSVTCAILSPDYVRQAFDFLHNTNQPLIIPPAASGDILYALKDHEGYELRLGPYDAEPPAITWREYLEEYESVDLTKLTADDLEGYYSITPETLDKPCDNENYWDFEWHRLKSPNAKAYEYLESLDLGRLASGKGTQVGGLSFYDDALNVSWYCGVHADDKISLGCLQERLKQLGEKVEIKVV